MFYCSSDPKKVILSKEKETKMNKILEIFTPFFLSVCGEECIYICIKTRPSFFLI